MQFRFHYFACGLMAILLLASTAALAENADKTTTTGRYLSVSNQPLPAQVDVFDQTLQVNFPSSVTTVHDAIQYLLRFSGYALMPLDQQSHAVQRTLQSSLPEVDRQLGPITLSNGLSVLVGEPFQLLVDPVHRLVGFRLKPIYARRYES